MIPSRLLWADLARSIAIFGILLIHACGPLFYQYGKTSQVSWLSANLLDSLARCSVPLFVMLSGALILNRDATPTNPKEVGRRIFKIFIPLVFWSILYLYYVANYNWKLINIFSIFDRPAMYHLWFAYMIIGVYIFIPVLEAIYNVILENPKLKTYILIIWVIFTCAPIYWPLPIFNLMQQYSFFGYGGYFLIGGLIARQKMIRGGVLTWLLIYILSSAITFGLTWHYSREAQKPIEDAYHYFSLNVIVSTVALFSFFTSIKVKNSFAPVIRYVADLSFLIFLMHPPILERVGLYITALNLKLPTLVTLLLITFISFMICLAISAIIRLIPKSKIIFG